MITVTVGISKSEPIRLDKDVEILATFNGVFRDTKSLEYPVVLIETDFDSVAQANYCEIQELGRYYFITGKTLVRTGLVALDCRVDVLSSFASEIRANTAIFRRAESSSAYNLYINDGSLVSYQDPYVLTEPFPEGFDAPTFILNIAGD